jgi:hypothetical protein
MALNENSADYIMATGDLNENQFITIYWD